MHVPAYWGQGWFWRWSTKNEVFETRILWKTPELSTACIDLYSPASGQTIALMCNPAA